MDSTAMRQVRTCAQCHEGSMPKDVAPCSACFDDPGKPYFMPIARAASGVFAEQVGGTYYADLAIQPATYSMANNLDSLQHTAIKYITRFRAKNGKQDLEKAIHTIQLLIDWEYNGTKEKFAKRI